MVDYQDKKVPIFTGINDEPIIPTSESGGNISHLYNLYNGLIDNVQDDFSQFNLEFQNLLDDLDITFASIQNSAKRAKQIEDIVGVQESIYTFSSITLNTPLIDYPDYSYGFVGEIPISGTITKIEISPSLTTSAVDVFFGIDKTNSQGYELGGIAYDNEISFLDWNITNNILDGQEWEILGNNSSFVEAGAKFYFEVTGVETETFTVTIYIDGVVDPPTDNLIVKVSNNETAITNNRIYHDGKDNDLQNQINLLSEKLQFLETLQSEYFEVNNITFVEDNGYYYANITIPKSGYLLEAYLNDATNQYDTYFYINSVINYFNIINSDMPGYNFAFAPEVGRIFINTSDTFQVGTAINDTLITSVKLKILA